MAMITWTLLLLQLPLCGSLVEAFNSCAPVEYFVPRDDRTELATDTLVKVTYTNALFGDINPDDEFRNLGAFWQCCGRISPDTQSVDFQGRTLETRLLNCSIIPALGDSHFVGSSPGIAPPEFCMRVNSSLDSYIVAKSGRGDAPNPGCQFKVEIALSLSLYLKRFWRVRITNRSPILASVLTREECSDASDASLCNLTVRTKPILELEASRSRLFSGLLGTVEWFGALSMKKHGGLSSQEYKLTLGRWKKPIRVAQSRREPMHQLPNSQENFTTELFDFSLSIFGGSVAAANGLQLGRRSLQARVKGQGEPHFQWSIYLTVTGTLISLAGVSMIAILCAGKKEDESPREFLDTVPILPPRYSYSKLQRATKFWSQKLGDGAFGSVYEGTLPNGTRVAVKVLEKTSVQGEKQFRAEVASMGSIRHLNLVRLHGFCSEGTHRLLVYEYMANGSVDSWLFGKKQGEKLLDWEQRLNIAMGTARALAYLHEECSDHIIHLDVKPENILLDHQFCPKLSDFGLAKLMDREQSRVVTSMRGTPGYLAPEWLLPHAAVTAKTDVYSFGMVLLELISGRENTNFALGKEQWYFPAWAFKLMGEARTMELLDKRLHIEEVEYFHKQDAVRAIHVALLCIQDDPAMRPSMSRVLHMLQGHVEPEPLNARQAAIEPPRRLVTAFAASHVRDASSTERQEVAQNNDSRKNSCSNDHVPNDILKDLQNDMRNDHIRADVNQRAPATVATIAPISSRLPAVSESPRIMETPKLPPKVPQYQILEEMRKMPPHHSLDDMKMPPHEALEDLEEDKDYFMLEPELPAAILAASQYRSNKGDRMAGVHVLGSNPKCIPPWPVKGDVILLRGAQGDFHGVVRDVRVQTKQMRLGVLHRLSSESRWSVREEESMWRHWNESIRTLDFWVILRWGALPGRGYEKFPVEWQVK